MGKNDPHNTNSLVNTKHYFFGNCVEAPNYYKIIFIHENIVTGDYLAGILDN
jgi:hypothetical protein